MTTRRRAPSAVEESAATVPGPLQQPPPARHPLEPFVVVRASAGTGKTHALSTRMIRLIADGVAVEEIFAATFARKAAGEILARVLDRLASAADPATPHDTAALAAAIDRPGAEALFFRDILVRVTADLDRLAVGTLDSFFVTCADAARFELGLPQGWTIGGEADLALQRRRAIHRTIADALASPVGGAGAADSPAVVLANLMVQVSGGTTTTGLESAIEGIVNDLAGLHRDTEPKAWDWLRVPRPPASGEITAAIQTLATFDFGNTHFEKARDGALDALDTLDWKALVSKGLAPKLLAGETRYQRKEIDPAVAAAMWTLIEMARSAVLDRTAKQTRAIRELLDHYSATADRLLASDGMVSFDDVTRLVGTAAGDGTLDSARWRGISFAKHLLLDEFQDTSPGQWRVLERLAEHAVTASGSFFAVGDRKQAIYGWRGGAAELIDALPTFFEAGARPLVAHDLAASYRSSPAVLDTVNRAFTRLGGAEPLADYAAIAAQATAAFPPHAAARQQLPGWVRVRTCKALEEGQKGADVLLPAAASRAAALSRQNPGKSVGVLVRTNEAAERVIARLKSEGIVASAEGGQPLADSAAVELVLSVLHLVDHPSDTAARFHLATSPLAAALALDPTGAVGEIPEACLSRLDGMRRELVDAGYGPVIAGLAGAVAPWGSHRDRRRLEQLVAAARQWDMVGGGSREGLVRTEPFVTHCRTTNVADPVVSPIRVMTIHKAKGLEFDLVVLTDLDRKLVPRSPRVVVDRESPLHPIKRVLVHVSRELLPLFPDDWRPLCEAANQPVIREAIATLYVGLTRAAQGMEILILPATAKEQKVPKTLGGVIRATLPDTPEAPAESVLWSHGHLADPDDDSLPEETGRPSSPAEPATASRPKPGRKETPVGEPGGGEEAITPIELRDLPDGRRRRSRPLRTPSSAEGTRTVAASALLDPGSKAARSVGTLLHSWIEQFSWPSEWPGDDRFRALASREPLLGPQVESLLADFRTFVAAPAVAEMLSEPAPKLPAKFVAGDLPAGPADPQLQREQAFALDVGEGTLLGVMDRLIVWRRRGKPVAAEVVDFKFDGMGKAINATARERARILAEKTAFYAPQLRAYRTAVARLYGLAESKVSCDLVFMRSGDVVPVKG